jgi:hypothetical protein
MSTDVSAVEWKSQQRLWSNLSHDVEMESMDFMYQVNMMNIGNPLYSEIK